MDKFSVRQIESGDKPWITELVTEHWGSPVIVACGRQHDVRELAGFVAVGRDGQRLGLVTYRVEPAGCHIVTLNSLKESTGIGTALVEPVIAEARQSGCRRVWLVTTNDNLRALRFYQKRGFALVAVHRNAVREARRLKPEIPLAGLDGIPLRDEIEMELVV